MVRQAHGENRTVGFKFYSLDEVFAHNWPLAYPGFGWNGGRLCWPPPDLSTYDDILRASVDDENHDFYDVYLGCLRRFEDKVAIILKYSETANHG
jgi:hypothetical protein